MIGCKLVLGILIIIILCVVSFVNTQEHFKFVFNKDGSSFGKYEKRVHDAVVKSEALSKRKRQEQRVNSNEERTQDNVEKLKARLESLTDRIEEVRREEGEIPTCSNIDTHPFPNDIDGIPVKDHSMIIDPGSDNIKQCRNTDDSDTNLNLSKDDLYCIDKCSGLNIPNMNRYCKYKPDGNPNLEAECKKGNRANYCKFETNTCNYNPSTKKDCYSLRRPPGTNVLTYYYPKHRKCPSHPCPV